jgi:hypothetical protein
MATKKITFTSMHCERQQDVFGTDEIYLYLDGVENWNHAMKKGDSETFSIQKSFDGTMKVEVKEKNPNSWKSLGTVTIVNGYSSPAEFKTPGAHYKLYFNIK